MAGVNVFAFLCAAYEEWEVRFMPANEDWRGAFKTMHIRDGADGRVCFALN